MRPPKAVSAYMASIGSKGGKKKGAAKKRPAAHYAAMVKARGKKR